MDNPSRPLFNRNVLGGGPPGSTVKPFIGLAGLDSGMRRAEDKLFSTGEFHIPGQRRGYRDAHGGAGWTDLHKSIAESVNYYYYKLAYDMGIAALRQVDAQVRFRPADRHRPGRRKRRHRAVAGMEGEHSKEPWYPGETVIAGIGQGYWKATVLQLAQAPPRSPAVACAIARTWSRSVATATTRPGNRCRNRRRSASPTTPSTCARCSWG